MWQNRHYLLDMSYLEVFGVLTGVGVDIAKFFEAGVLKPEPEGSRSLKNVTPFISGANRLFSRELLELNRY